MKKLSALIGGILAAALLPVIASADTPPPTPAGTVSMAKARGDKVRVTTRKTLFHDSADRDVATRARLTYKVPKHGRFLRVSQVWGKYNYEGSRTSCNGFRGVKFTFKFADGRKVALRIPCDSDTVNSNAKKVDLKFYAQDPCPIGPYCPPATTYRVTHELDLFGAANPDWTRGVFIA